MAARCTDKFAQNLTSGIIIWFGYQALVNIGAMVGILPLTGLPFPFLSYGSSALIVSMAAIGILINISQSAKQ